MGRVPRAPGSRRAGRGRRGRPPAGERSRESSVAAGPQGRRRPALVGLGAARPDPGRRTARGSGHGARRGRRDWGHRTLPGSSCTSAATSSTTPDGTSRRWRRCIASRELVDEIESPYLRRALVDVDRRSPSPTWRATTRGPSPTLAGRWRSDATRTPHERIHGTMAVMWCAYHLGDWATGPRPARRAPDGAVDDAARLLPVHPGRPDGRCPCPGPRRRPRPGPRVGRSGSSRIMTEPGLPEALLARVLVATGDPGRRRTARPIDGRRRASTQPRAERPRDPRPDRGHAGAARTGRRCGTSSRRPGGGSRALAILGPACDRAEAMALVADGSRSARSRSSGGRPIGSRRSASPVRARADDDPAGAACPRR